MRRAKFLAQFGFSGPTMKDVPPPIERKHLFLGLIVVLGCYAVLLNSAAIDAHFFDGYFANGAFQLFDPLRRIAAGQVPGRDFMIFHGIGSVLVHYPVYAALGKSLYASEASRLVNSPFFFVLSPFVVAYLASRSLTIAFGTTLLMLAIGPLVLLQLYNPVNAMLGVRSAFAVLACAAFLIDSPRRRLISASLLIAVAIVGSTEHGIAVVIATVCVGGLVLVTKKTTGPLIAAGFGIAIALVVFALFSRSHLLDLLRYNYSDVPGDQPWYFGGPPNPFGGDGLRSMLGQTEFRIRAVVGGICLVLFVVRLFKEGLTQRMTAALLFATYGLATLGTMNGYVYYGNVEPFVRACILAAVIAWVPRRALPFWVDASLGACVLAVVTLQFMPKRHQYSGAPTVLGVHLSKRWERHLAEVNSRVPMSAHLWSDYSGMVEATHPQFQPTNDYIIHALGAERREQYSQSFARLSPDWVRVNNLCSWAFGTWLHNENWPFFRQIFVGYEPVYQDTLGVLFQKSKPITLSAPTQLKIDNDGCVTQSADHDSIWELSVDYELVAASRFPFISSVPRYLIQQTYLSGSAVTAPMPVSVPLKGYGRHWAFPMRLQAGASIKLCPVVRSRIGAAAFSFTKVESREMFVSRPMLDYMNCTGKEPAYIAH
jgi:hypothetical protein